MASGSAEASSELMSISLLLSVCECILVKGKTLLRYNNSFDNNFTAILFTIITVVSLGYLRFTQNILFT